jgi:peptidoglycan-associated lipoprotein
VLLLQGASTDQIDTLSYGEEQPAMRGHTEEAWDQNRRVELIYKVK